VHPIDQRFQGHSDRFKYASRLSGRRCDGPSPGAFRSCISLERALAAGFPLERGGCWARPPGPPWGGGPFFGTREICPVAVRASVPPGRPAGFDQQPGLCPCQHCSSNTFSASGSFLAVMGQQLAALSPFPLPLHSPLNDSRGRPGCISASTGARAEQWIHPRQLAHQLAATLQRVYARCRSGAAAPI